MRQMQELLGWLSARTNLIRSECLGLYQAFLVNLHDRAAQSAPFAILVRYLPKPIQMRAAPIVAEEIRIKVDNQAMPSRVTVGRLSDVFLPLLAYMRGFELLPTGSAEDLAAQLNKLIGDAQTQALNQGFNADAFADGLFPVTAWVDERVSLLHHWESVHVWQAYLLQKRYFRTTHAGVRFFEALEELEADNLDVLELYFLCLCMGFKGKYNQKPNDPELAEIRQQLFRVLEGAGWAAPIQTDKLLFPAAYQPLKELQPVHEAWWRPWITPKSLLLVVGPPLIFILILIFCSVSLSSSIDAFWKPISL